MLIYLIALVASVFIGTEIIALPTPAFQLTPYRVLAMGAPLLFILSFKRGGPGTKVQTQSVSFITLLMYLFWWVWALASGIWAQDSLGWARAMFLLSLGILSILALYFYVKDERDWTILLRVVWFMMTLLVIWGFYEIATGDYLLANLEKLDKYRTFDEDPMTRIPITHFENQNDYATMLVAYLSVNLVLFNKDRRLLSRIVLSGSFLAALYLIYRTGSRLSLLAAFVFILIYCAGIFKWDMDRKGWGKILLVLLALGLFLLATSPSLQSILDTFLYTHSGDILTGDTGRVNLIRNGLYFLAATLGLGVGAGNIEHWMRFYRVLPTQDIVNMHNWWFEILVAYGVPVFIFYVIMYLAQILQLFRLQEKSPSSDYWVSQALLAFMVTFILASMTSATNMLIEWHWVFMGLVLSYIRIQEEKEEGVRYESLTY